MSKPTMRDVAARAGVDTSTVSRALGDRTRVMLSDETVERVLVAAEELGYRPNALARGLRTQRSKIVGMLVPDLTNPFFPPLLRGLEQALEQHGYTLIVVNTDNDADRERSAVRSLVDRQVDGLVLATAHIDSAGTDVGSSRVPAVLVNRRSEQALAPSVVPNDVGAVREVVDHLHGLGHRRLAHVAGPQDLSTGRDRLAAFLDACRDVGVEEPAVEVADAFMLGAGEVACRRLLERSRRFTALFGGNDLLALGSLRALQAAGCRVPEDVSLVGYNDMPLVDLVDPPLTTVRVPQYELGQRAGRMLLALLEDEPIDEQVVLVPAHLVVRGSTARAPLAVGG